MLYQKYQQTGEMDIQCVYALIIAKEVSKQYPSSGFIDAVNAMCLKLNLAQFADDLTFAALVTNYAFSCNQFSKNIKKDAEALMECKYYSALAYYYDYITSQNTVMLDMAFAGFEELAAKDYPAAHYYCAICILSKQNNVINEEVMAHLKASAKTFAPAMNYLGVIYYNQGNYQAANFFAILVRENKYDC